MTSLVRLAAALATAVPEPGTGEAPETPGEAARTAAEIIQQTLTELWLDFLEHVPWIIAGW